uniref:Uncharacterized protein n=1 Tax=Leptospirillum ferriphilum TaxID=178606 RepID=A0A7C3LW11_9BACT
MMPITVKLKEIIQEMEFSSDESTSWFDLNTGQLLWVPDEAFRMAEEPERVSALPDPEEEESVEWARKILQDEDGYVPLPSRWEINEYRIMENFIDSLSDETVRNALYRAIRGKGAFRAFKDRIDDLGVREDWFGYREAAFRKIAVEWCEEHGISFLEG